MEEIIMELKNIYEIAAKAGIDEKYIEPYGKNKAKIDLSINETLSDKENGKLILVTAITPTKAGEGKTTMSIALTEGLNRLNKKTL
jgi:formate--tetrahydrofolate ligase